MSAGCSACREAHPLPFRIATAFQPIVDVRTMRPYAYEALVRGVGGEGAGWVLGQVTPEIRYHFDQECRVTAIKDAVAAGLLETDARLSINFLPNAIYEPRACIRLTLETAAEVGLPTDRLIFEFTENEELDPEHIRKIVEVYRALGFATAIDDFGAGHSGLNRLANLQTDIVKLDMELIRGIEASAPRRHIVAATARLCEDMGLTVFAEGIETRGEFDVLRDLGIRYLQGYYLAVPELRRLPAIDLSEDRARAAHAA